MDVVRVTRWLKGVGETLQLGEPLLEVETEKSVVEIEAAVSGRLSEILVAVGQEAKVGDPIAWVDSAEALQPAADKIQAPARVSTVPAANPRRTSFATGRPLSTPAARRLGAEHGLDLRGVTGSGPGGRVQLADVASLVDNGGPVRPAPSDARPVRGGMSAMQRALARAMTLSNATVPQFTVERSLDCSAMRATRAEFRAAAVPGAPALSANDFLLQALARALIDLPAMNATYDGDREGVEARIVTATGTHIGLVVALDDGLLVPVLRDVERFGLQDLARQRRDCVARALKGRLRREELTGATCSLSNLGARGPDRFTAMINPPESAILAVGRQRDCVVARHGGFAVRPLCELTLTVDHRAVNGRLAADFLARVVEILESRDWRL
jgi:pyruvate dehydrogenase E2 component (dihydrolipoamide acetyltransferase)